MHSILLNGTHKIIKNMHFSFSVELMTKYATTTCFIYILFISCTLLVEGLPEKIKYKISINASLCFADAEHSVSYTHYFVGIDIERAHRTIELNLHKMYCCRFRRSLSAEEERLRACC